MLEFSFSPHQFYRYAQENVNRLLVGNKSDLAEKRKVTYEEGLELGKDHSKFLIMLTFLLLAKLASIAFLLLRRRLKVPATSISLFRLWQRQLSSVLPPADPRLEIKEL